MNRQLWKKVERSAAPVAVIVVIIAALGYHGGPRIAFPVALFVLLAAAGLIFATSRGYLGRGEKPDEND